MSNHQPQHTPMLKREWDPRLCQGSCKQTRGNKTTLLGTSLVVQGLRLLAFSTQGVQVQSLVGELRPYCASQSKALNIKLKQCGTGNKRSLIKTLKMKKSFLKEFMN